MKSLKALLVCAVFSMLCSCMAYGNVEMGKLAELDRVDITDKIKSTPVAPAVQNNNSSEGIPSIVPQMLELEP